MPPPWVDDDVPEFPSVKVVTVGVVETTELEVIGG